MQQPNKIILSVPSISWNQHEDKLLQDLFSNYKEIQMKWLLISTYFPEKTALQCRSRWNDKFKDGLKENSIENEKSKLDNVFPSDELKHSGEKRKTEFEFPSSKNLSNPIGSSPYKSAMDKYRPSLLKIFS